MKNYLFVFLFIITGNTFANEEFSIEVSVDNQEISILKSYVGEPVSKRRRLVVTQKCGNRISEIYNDKYCDFSNFKLDKSSLSFVAKLYNPDTGECTGPNTKSFNLKIENRCK